MKNDIEWVATQIAEGTSHDGHGKKLGQNQEGFLS